MLWKNICQAINKALKSYKAKKKNGKNIATYILEMQNNDTFFIHSLVGKKEMGERYDRVSIICIKKASMTSVIHTYTQIYPRKRLRIIIPGADKANRSYHTWLVVECKMVHNNLSRR